jgi:hypothetical protein
MQVICRAGEELRHGRVQASPRRTNLIVLKWSTYRTPSCLATLCVPPRPAVPGGLQSAVAVARRNLRSLQHFPHDDLVLLATIPSYPDTSQVELSKDVWQSVNAVVHTVTIGLESVRLQWPVASSRPTTPQRRLLTSSFCCFLLLSEVQTSADPERDSTAVSCDIVFFFGTNGSKARHLSILYPPSRLPDVFVELLFTSSWGFLAVYPPPQIAIPSSENQSTAQSLTWAVEAERGGGLIEKTTGAEVTYLYWEAR